MAKIPKSTAISVPAARKQVVIYARVSSKEQEKEGFSIPAQLKLLKEYAAANGFMVAQEYVDVETAKQSGRTAFGELVAYLKGHPAVRVMLVEKTDRLYRNLKDWVTVDELDVEIHFPKEGVVLSRESRSSEKFMHGIKVLMAKNYIDNLSEEVRKGLHQKAREIRAASARGLEKRGERAMRFLTVLERRLGATRVAADRNRLALRREAEALDRATDRIGERRLETLARLTAALNTHDPQRTLERGYALALGPDGEPLPNAAAVRRAGAFDLRMADATLPANIRDQEPAQPSLLPDSDSDGG